MQELTDILKKLKRHKTPGPDEISIELFKELETNSKKKLLHQINQIWMAESITEDQLLARVVLIYKKGDTNLCENYRPISLLNSVYKILASAIHKILEEGIEQDLQKTQYGFRKRRGTADALYNIKRIITAGESTQTKTFLLLLDWAKAFDKINHEGLFSALARMNVAPKLISLIKKMYQNASFYVEIDC